MTSTKNNYAFEIRFVDDNIVQVFDIAAKRQKEGTGLPVEYNQDDVLKGQLRYSKLVGSTPSTDIDDEYQHQVTTKRSNNRRSIQRHTFFMMGSGGDDSIDATITNNSSKDHHSPVAQTLAAVTPPPQRPQLSLSPPADVPSAPLQIVSPLHITSPPIHSPLDAYSPPSSPVPFSPIPLSPISRTPSVQAPPAVKHSLSMSQRKRIREDPISMNQISPIIVATSPAPQVYYSEDYSSMTMMDSRDDSSKQNIQQEKGASSGCCIIS